MLRGYVISAMMQRLSQNTVTLSFPDLRIPIFSHKNFR